VLATTIVSRVASRVGDMGIKAGRGFEARCADADAGRPTLITATKDRIDQVRDRAETGARSFEKNVPGHGVGRDGCRTPMQWGLEGAMPVLTGAALAAASRRFVHEKSFNLHADPQSIRNSKGADPASPRQLLPLCGGGDYVTIEGDGDMLLVTGREARWRCHRGWRHISAPPVSIRSELNRPSDGDFIVLSTPGDRHGEPIHGTLDVCGTMEGDQSAGQSPYNRCRPGVSRDLGLCVAKWKLRPTNMNIGVMGPRLSRVTNGGGRKRNILVVPGKRARTRGQPQKS